MLEIGFPTGVIRIPGKPGKIFRVIFNQANLSYKQTKHSHLFGVNTWINVMKQKNYRAEAKCKQKCGTE